GELLEPELANLHIWTVGVGKRLARRTSLDLVLHGYRQVEARSLLHDTELDDRPTGLDREIGWELDAVFGWRRLAEWDLEIVGAYFRPGDAFQRPDDAFLAKAQLRYRF
ncbi:MAG: alginate export family protein, partial [Acidobacteriota bacterium]|nr:alginate export family protein [Acidobacteriota bacterium]